MDETVLFTPLTPPQIERIVELMLDDLRRRLAERNVTLEISDEAHHFIAEQGYDPVYGARPLRRFIAREVETRIARALLRDAVPDGATVWVRLRGDQLVVTHATEPAGSPA